MVILGSFDASRLEPLHLLIRAARAGEPAAVREVLVGVRARVKSAWPTIAQATVVPVPGHRPGRTPPLVIAAARLIAESRGWTYAGDTLRRRRRTAEAKTGPTRYAEAEVASLQWAPHGGIDTIVLVDDVLRTGTSIHVCRDAIRATGDERPVVAITLASAITGS